jgi:LPXTG-motif cell wall-anchored protein
VVTAKKTWNVPEALWPDSVTVELYANGVLASSLVPSIEPIVELTRANNYSYTWTDMPTYINGASVVWTMKEVKVGSEVLTVNGSFVNWIDSYNRYETRNADGELTRLTLEVVNDIRRTMLKVEKTDETGLKALSGAAFRLTAVDSSGKTISNGYNLTLTTDENGWATFDNLTAGFYTLVEERAPGGYTGIKETIYLYVDASGKIKQATLTDGKLKTLEDNQFTNGLSRPSDFTVRVPNQTIRPLPETGGGGTIGFTVIGLLLMGAAVLTMIHRQRRKEDTPDA